MTLFGWILVGLYTFVILLQATTISKFAKMTDDEFIDKIIVKKGKLTSEAVNRALVAAFLGAVLIIAILTWGTGTGL